MLAAQQAAEQEGSATTTLPVLTASIPAKPSANEGVAPAGEPGSVATGKSEENAEEVEDEEEDEDEEEEEDEDESDSERGHFMPVDEGEDPQQIDPRTRVLSVLELEQLFLSSAPSLTGTRIPTTQYTSYLTAT